MASSTLPSIPWIQKKKSLVKPKMDMSALKRVTSLLGVSFHRRSKKVDLMVWVVLKSEAMSDISRLSA
ncbi:hypothetical protein QJS10_CPB18g00259 [Acorus calamus]|uniref:Uncharacterized protein n=1 Tax=Acorus calamus TaxID=4465 RepID=A0AAV9CPG6_ACOCL|nr:hypothetical protein QJS10_CPB18g00259 [Acorus calamus]